MSRTALCFLVGAVAICGLPPLNGFVSEFLVYLGLFRTLGIEGRPAFVGAAFAVPALALIGALAVACFVKVFGAVFLGVSRSEHAAQARESGPAMIGPMLVLVLCCFLIGLAPTWVAPVLNQAVRTWAPDVPASGADLTLLAPLNWVGMMGWLLLGMILLTGVTLWHRLRSRGVATGQTWGCGYVAPSARMQYTSSSFAQMLVGLFAWALRPRTSRPKDLPLFPQKAAFHSEVPDAVLEEGIWPTFRFGAWLFGWCRVFQQGSIQTYLLYIFLTLLALLLWR
jgi:hydrogenase-4 component B